MLGMSTLEEAFLGKKPNVSYFNFFGSSVYFPMTKYARKKLEPTTEVGIFVGYTDTPHNYQVYLSAKMLTVVNRDVKFDEEKAMRLSLEREIDLHVDEELLVPKDEPHDVEQPQAEDHGVAKITHADPSTRNGRKCTKEVDRLMLDAIDHVGAPKSQCR